MTEGTTGRIRGRREGSHGGQHTCATCSISYTNRHNLERHVREKHAGQSHVCEMCGATFPRRYRLETHVVKHLANGDKFRCTLCAATAPTRADFARHVRSHASADGGGTACPDCGIVFRQYWQMRKHKSRHATARQTCQICGRMFRYEKQLAHHLQTHLSSSGADAGVMHTATPLLAGLRQKLTTRGGGKIHGDGTQMSGRLVAKADDEHIDPPVQQDSSGPSLKHHIIRVTQLPLPVTPRHGGSESSALLHAKRLESAPVGPIGIDLPELLALTGSAAEHSDTGSELVRGMPLSSENHVVEVSDVPNVLDIDNQTSVRLNALTSEDMEDLIAPAVNDEGLNSDRVAGFSDERRPMTLEEAVRQITGDSPSDASMQIEFVSEFDTGSDLTNPSSGGADFAFETGASPAEAFETDLGGRHELGFELEVGSVDGDHLGADAEAFEDLHLGGSSTGDELQLELDISADPPVKDSGLGSAADDRYDGCREESRCLDSAPDDLELEVDAADLEGKLGAGLARLLGTGVRVEVERSQTYAETVMVITLVDE